MTPDLHPDELTALRAYAQGRRADLTATRLGEVRCTLAAAGYVRDCAHAESPMYVGATDAGREALAKIDRPHRLRIGSLCSGYGGLELGAELALGPLEHVWHGEYDAAPSKVLETRWPGVPNLGDIAAVTAGTSPHGTWSDREPIDLLCAGYPCQGESDAGLRRGEDDPRFRWPDVWAAIRALRPRLVFLENVRGHLNRSFPRVAADLSAIGYVLRWQCVRASDAGAAHKRERLFVVAWPEETPAPWLRGIDASGLADDLRLLPTPKASDTGTEGRRASEGFRPPLSQVVFETLLPTPRTLLPTPTAQNSHGNDRNNRGELLLPGAVRAAHWGAYAPAIGRWETVIGCPAPEPTITTKGRRQLSPLFVEWLMGLPAGWVTDIVTKRGDALRVLGNGVVPQAAALALRQLLTEPERPSHVQPDLFALAGSAA